MRALAALLLYCLSLGGCATSTGSSLMGARAESPARPKTSGYPAVQDLPPKRENAQPVKPKGALRAPNP